MGYSPKFSKRISPEDMDSTKSNDAKGHRKRVKEKFMKQDISQFSSLEIIEAILFFCNSRRDVKAEARILEKISRSSFLKFVFLEAHDLKTHNVKYVGENLLFLNKIIKEIISRYYKDRIIEYVFENHQQIVDYLMSRSAFLSREELRVLYLNAKNKLIEDIVVSRGTVNETAIYPREIIKIAIDKSAVSILISHNHPSGAPKASEADLAMTYSLREALTLIPIALQDHIIIGGNRAFSFKQDGLL